MQLHHNRGRLPPQKKEALQKILWTELKKQHIRIPCPFFYQESRTEPPQTGEIDIEATCSLTPPRTKYQYVVQNQEKQIPQLSLLIDVSASLTPEQRYLSLLLVHSLHKLSLPMSIQIFSTSAKNIASPMHKSHLPALMHDIQYALPPEYTNLQAGLLLLAEQHKKAISPLNISIIISDCVHNYGGAPDRYAVYIPHLLIFCFRAPNIHTPISGFPHTPIYNLSAQASLPNALHAIQNYCSMHST